MRLLHYLEIENFKRFSGKQRIELDHPSVFIGPNNCGKTTAIEAIGFWSRTVQFLHEAKVTSSSKLSPIQLAKKFQPATKSVLRAEHFWHNAVVRKGNQDILVTITVGLQHGNDVVPVPMRFQSGGKDWVDCVPDPAILNNPEVLDAAAKLQISLLYPISRLETSEHILEPSHIKELIRKGQAAQALRNICLLVHQHSPEAWEKIVGQMHRLFLIKLHQPLKNSCGTIDLFYKQNGITVPFDISLAGQGLQQTLLVLSFLYSPNRSVLLLDQPDTHLGIVQQKQLYTLMRNIAEETESQVVLTTHSHDLIIEARRDRNIILFTGKNIRRTNNIDEVLKALDRHGTYDYFQAIEYHHVLYLEGNTDFKILHAFAKQLHHSVVQCWSSTDRDPPVNVHCLQNIHPEPGMEPDLQYAERRQDDAARNLYYLQSIHPEPGMEPDFQHTKRKHSDAARNLFFQATCNFSSLRVLVPNLRGLAILDSDGKNQKDTMDKLPIVFWKRYEIENYFITRELLIKSIEHNYEKRPLLDHHKKLASQILILLIQKYIFNNNRRNFNIWNGSSSAFQQLFWKEKAKTCKLSTLAEEFYRKFATATGTPMLYKKNTLYQLIKLVEPESIPEEVTEKLDRLQDLLENSVPQE